MFKSIITCPSNKKETEGGTCEGKRNGSTLNINCSKCPAYQKYVKNAVKER